MDIEKEKAKSKAERNRKRKLKNQINRTIRRDEKNFLRRLMTIGPDCGMEYGN